MPSSPADSDVSDGRPRLRLAFVVPRFGENIVGGAELHASWITRRLAAAGHSVEVFTTCAVDHHTWRNALPAGTERWGDLLIRRFPTDARDLGIHGELERAISLGLKLSLDEELLWLRHGVSSSAMEDALGAEASRYDLVVAMPYLFGTTYFAWAAAPERTVLIPCLHDEAYARLGVTRKMLAGARGLLFNAPAEAALAGELVDDLPPWTVVGVGFDEPSGLDPDGFRRRHDLRRPFMLYVGRREGGKNTPLLADHFRRYKEQRGGDLELVFVGSGEPVPSHPDIREVKIDWSRRDDMYAAATVFCQPSTNESLSIVLMQAWLCDCPVVVHGHCAVTREHCERSNGGLWFTNYAEFEAVLDRLLASADLRTALARNGADYVRREYGWDVVVDRFEAAAASWAGAVTGSGG